LATQTKIPRIGYLSPGPREAFRDQVDAFLQGLRELGYVEGQSIAIEWRFTASGPDAQFAERAAAELVGLPVDLIVTSTTPPTQAAKRATRTIPIVATIVANPVETGLLGSLARPGGNLTGLTVNVPGLLTKYVDLLREVVPGLSRVAALVQPTSAAGVSEWNEFRPAAEAAGLVVERVDMDSAADLDRTFETPAIVRAEALACLSSSLVYPVRARFAELALQRRLPTITNAREFAGDGLLMTYGPNLAAITRRGAVYVDKILKGAEPGSLPVEQPTVFDFVVNLKTAKALGLTIPPSVQPLVTEWIQ